MSTMENRKDRSVFPAWGQPIIVIGILFLSTRLECILQEL